MAGRGSDGLVACPLMHSGLVHVWCSAGARHGPSAWWAGSVSHGGCFMRLLDQRPLWRDAGTARARWRPIPARWDCVATFAVPAVSFRSPNVQRKYSTVKTIAKTNRTKAARASATRAAEEARDKPQQGENAAQARGGAATAQEAGDSENAATRAAERPRRSNQPGGARTTGRRREWSPVRK